MESANCLITLFTPKEMSHWSYVLLAQRLRYMSSALISVNCFASFAWSLSDVFILDRQSFRTFQLTEASAIPETTTRPLLLSNLSLSNLNFSLCNSIIIRSTPGTSSPQVSEDESASAETCSTSSCTPPTHEQVQRKWQSRIRNTWPATRDTHVTCVRAVQIRRVFI